MTRTTAKPITEPELEDERAAHTAEVGILVMQVEAWAEAFGTLANSVLEGVYLGYDVREDSGGSTFLCTCPHDLDGYPHDQDCGAFLTSQLPEAT